MIKHQGKTQITFQKLRNGNKYTIVYLINGSKHIKSFVCDDSEKAKEKIEKIEEVIRKHYEK